MPTSSPPISTPAHAVPAFEGRLLRVVACEDMPVMRHMIVTGLCRLGLQAVGVEDGVALDRALAEVDPGIVILDIGLPGEDGFSIAQRLRRDRPELGIIMLTALNRMDDRVKGLDCGADHYLAKPVDMRELASAIGSLQRRLGQSGGKAGTWRLEPLQATLVTPGGVAIGLTDNELRFLTPLLRLPGEVIGRDDLAAALDQIPDVYAMRRMETLVSRLKGKVLRASPQEPLPVRARHGRGYAFLSERAAVQM